MYYHASLLLLFRPFLKATFTNQIDVVPREVCRQAANSISEIWNRHLSMYGTAGVYTFQVHCLFTACTIHVINLPTIAATNYFVQACNIFQKLIPRNDWAKSSLIILRSLVEKWNLILPQDAEEALYREFDDGSNKSRTASEQGQHPGSGEVGSPQSGGSQRDSVHRNPLQYAQSLPQHHQDTSPWSATSASSGGLTQWSPMRNPTSPVEDSTLTLKPARFLESQIQQASGGVTAAEHNGVPVRSATSYLYAPQPGQPAPMLVPVDVVPGEGGASNARKSARDGIFDEVGSLQDGVEGLTFEDDWRDPFMGYLGPQR